jgi:hypothetical protein
MRKIDKRVRNSIKGIVKVLAIAGASVWADRLLEAKTYDAELTQSVAQILDARYGNDTTETGRKWRIISAKENITANDVYDFLMEIDNRRAYESVSDVCPTCVLGLAELIRKQNLTGKGGSGNGEGIKPSGPGTQPQPQPQSTTEISKEARDFFSETIEVEGKKMSALEYLIACGYLPGEIEAIYKKIKSDWGNEKVNLNSEFLDSYAREVIGKVLPYPGEKKPELTQAQIDSLRSWALDTLDAAFEKSLGPAKNQWELYKKWGDKSLDGIYNFCLDVRTLVKKGTNESKAIEKVIEKISPYTEERKRIEEEMKH